MALPIQLYRARRQFAVRRVQLYETRTGTQELAVDNG